MARWDREDSGPTIPEWFFEAVETEASEHIVEVEDCDVAYRTWPAQASATPGTRHVQSIYVCILYIFWRIISPSGKIHLQYELVLQ